MQRAFDANDLVGAPGAIDHRHRAKEALATDVFLPQIAQPDAGLPDMTPWA